MDLIAAIGTATNGIAIAKALRSIEASYDQAKLKSEIAEITESLSDAKMALIEAKEAIAQRDQEIDRLKIIAEDRKSLVVGDGGYKYQLGLDGLPSGLPFCPKCDPVDGRLVQLVQDGDVEAAKCPVCSTSFKPVTCYTGGGATLVSERDARREAIRKQQDRAIASARNRHWMA